VLKMVSCIHKTCIPINMSTNDGSS
jgi:hypothetical protein